MRDFQPVVDRCVARYRDGTDAARLFHGRGRNYDGFEDVTVDLFPPCLMIGSFGEDEAGVLQLADLLSTRLTQVKGICVQLRDGRRTRSRVVFGSVPDRLVVTEGDMRFVVRPTRNQNVGLFLDMAPARRWLRERSADCAVLNLFAYTCGFSVAAVAGRARLVVNNDMSRSALEWGRENHLENGHDPRHVAMLPHNLFKSWWKIRQLGPYDLVVIDPPTNQQGSFNAEKQYGQIMKRIPEFTRPGGIVLACLNSPFLNTDFLPEQMSRWCAKCEFLESLPASADFPDRFEDRALKIVAFRYSA